MDDDRFQLRPTGRQWPGLCSRRYQPSTRVTAGKLQTRRCVPSIAGRPRHVPPEPATVYLPCPAVRGAPTPQEVELPAPRTQPHRAGPLGGHFGKGTSSGRSAYRQCFVRVLFCAARGLMLRTTRSAFCIITVSMSAFGACSLRNKCLSFSPGPGPRANRHAQPAPPPRRFGVRLPVPVGPGQTPTSTYKWATVRARLFGARRRPG